MVNAPIAIRFTTLVVAAALVDARFTSLPATATPLALLLAKRLLAVAFAETKPGARFVLAVGPSRPACGAARACPPRSPCRRPATPPRRRAAAGPPRLWGALGKNRTRAANSY